MSTLIGMLVGVLIIYIGVVVYEMFKNKDKR